MNAYEQFVFDCYKKEQINWMPLGECISLKKNAQEDVYSVEDDVSALRNEIGQMKGMMKAIMSIVEAGKKGGARKAGLDNSV